MTKKIDPKFKEGIKNSIPDEWHDAGKYESLADRAPTKHQADTLRKIGKQEVAHGRMLDTIARNDKIKK